jgi:hypothetical protein
MAEVVDNFSRRLGPHCDQPSRVRIDRSNVALGSVAFENKINENGERLIWLELRVVDRLRAMRGRGEDYSQVILRLAAEGSPEGRSRGDLRRRAPFSFQTSTEGEFRSDAHRYLACGSNAERRRKSLKRLAVVGSIIVVYSPGDEGRTMVAIRMGGSLSRLSRSKFSSSKKALPC